ncbi:AAA family ATPase [Clostridium sp.]|uniref:AAA family ATPase n=1 Tax=Clostridium sp. TaxID=1506 RepID=UPI003D6CA9CF
MDKKGYNIFISGESGTGKTSYIIKKVEEYAKSNLELYPIINVSPEDIPLQVKIILIGTNMSYSILNTDDDFNELFKIKAEFDHQIENEKENLQKILGFLTHYITENSLLHITKNGIIKILRYATRLAENRAYLTASMNKVLEIIDLASVLARKQGINLIDSYFAGEKCLQPLMYKYLCSLK